MLLVSNISKVIRRRVGKQIRVTENSNNKSLPLVAQPGRGLLTVLIIMRRKNKKKALGGIRTRDLYRWGNTTRCFNDEPYLTKVTQTKRI
jgi:hypothetical protein